MNCQPVAALTMSTMSRNNSAPSLQGFSVYQPSVGAPLQFFPSLGSKELDVLIDAYLPGPASAKEKRSTVSMDFCEHARQTGETFKFYPVYNTPVNSAGASPAASSPWDSTYDSSFDVSPVLGDTPSWSFSSIPQSGPPRSAPRSKARPAKVSTPPSRPSTDFSSLPGMKILTRDGRDVTNSATRGCKTKEQRDHAHLMRIIKACDSCKRKKVRCDPSHKKRSASQAQSQTESKPAKKAKKAVAEPQPSSNTPTAESVSFELDPSLADLAFQGIPGTLEESWEQFVQYDENYAPNPALNLEGYDFWLDPEGLLSPATNSSSVSPSSQQPVTPFSAEPNPYITNVIESQQPALPYFNSGGSTSDYVDFNLYSPVSNFLDEEPLPLKSSQIVSTSQGDTDSWPLDQPGSNDGSTVLSNAYATFASDSDDSLGVSPSASSFNDVLSTPTSELLGDSWSGLPAGVANCIAPGDPNICSGASSPGVANSNLATVGLEQRASATTPSAESPVPTRHQSTGQQQQQPQLSPLERPLPVAVRRPTREPVTGPERDLQGPGYSAVFATDISPTTLLSTNLSPTTVVPPTSPVVSWSEPAIAAQYQQIVAANGRRDGALSSLASNISQNMLATETSSSVSFAATGQSVHTVSPRQEPGGMALRAAAIHNSGENAVSHILTEALDQYGQHGLDVPGMVYGSESSQYLSALASVVCLGVVGHLVLAKLLLGSLAGSGLVWLSSVLVTSWLSVASNLASPFGEPSSKMPDGIFSSFIGVAMSLAKAAWHRGSTRLSKTAPRPWSVGAADNAKLSGKLAHVRCWIVSLGWKINRLNGAKMISKGLV